MEYIEVPGSRVPAIGFGTFRMTGDECAEAVAEALRAGYRHLDTAEIYDNEEAVASGIRSTGIERGDLFITTKAWMDDLSPDGIRRSLDGSLRKLDTEYIDLWLVHWPNPAFPIRDTLTAMSELAARGAVKQLGVSNFPAALFEQAASIAPVVCNQVEYHPYLGQQKVLTAARAHGAFVTAYAPIAMGRVRDDRTLREIGDRHRKTPAQIALRWLIQQRHVAAIPKSARAERMRENIGVFDFELSDAEMEQIHSLTRGERLIDPDSGPAWDEE